MALVGPLVFLSDLAEFQQRPPFSEMQAQAAGESVRADCGWHIAPSVTETVTLDCDGGRVLFLPTLHLTAVAEVRDLTGSTPSVLTGWRMSRAGMLSRAAGWPVGFGAVEVDFTHGYDQCPAELLPVIADRTRRRVAQESLGSRSVSYVPESDSLAAAVARYRLPARP